MFAVRVSGGYSHGVPTTIEDRLVVGDVSVVPDLYRQHGAFIHTISRELVGAAADRLTQQVFTEAWRDRLSFDPSLGTVRNWLIRRTRARVSKISPEAEMAVDRLVVADSLHRMDDLRRQVVLAGIDASDADALARRLDQPVATIRANLRRGTDQLTSDLAESRTDGEHNGLINIMADGPPDFELVTPPEVVWQAIAAELDLDVGAVTTEDFNRSDEPASDEPALDPQTSGDEIDTTAAADEADGVVPTPAGEEIEETAGANGVDRSDDIVTEPPDSRSAESAATSAADHNGDIHSVDQLRSMAEAAELDRPTWIVPAVVAIALVALIIVVLSSL